MAKKIGIISDTHGLLRPEVLEILKTCDCILHAGDVDRPELLDRIRCLGSIYVVRGNNDRDWAEGIAKTLRFTIEGVTETGITGLPVRCFIFSISTTGSRSVLL